MNKFINEAYKRLIDKYSFLLSTISEDVLMNKIFFKGVSDKMSLEEVVSLALKNVNDYFIDESQTDPEKLVQQFVDYTKTHGNRKTFNFFNKVFKDDIIDLDYFLSFLIEEKTYKKYFYKLLNDEGIDPFKDNLENKLLKQVLQLYSLSLETSELSSSDIIEADGSVVQDPVRKYLLDIRGFKVLSPQEEQEAFRKYIETKDPEIREYIYEHNLKFAFSVAKKYAGVAGSLSILDLVQEGNIGLGKAIDKFDPDKGYKFSTYAFWWIRQNITRAIANNSRTVRMPVHFLEDYNKIRRFVRDYNTEFGKDPSYDEISSATGFTLDKIKETINLYNKFDSPESIDRYIGEDEDTLLGDFIPGDGFEDLQRTVEVNQMAEVLKKYSGSLTDREKRVILLRFGFVTGRQMTLEEVGHIFHVTRERIRQIESKALMKMRRNAERERRLIDAKQTTLDAVSQSLTYAGFVRKVTNKDIIISDYVSFDKLVKVSCKKCGFEFEKLPSSLIADSSCPMCLKLEQSNKNYYQDKRRDRSFKERLQRVGKGIIEVPDLSSESNTIKPKCKICNYSWTTTRDELISKCYCPKCSEIERIVSSKEDAILLQNFTRSLNGNTLELTGYKNPEVSFFTTCHKCGLTKIITPAKFLQYPSCPDCSKLTTYSISSYQSSKKLVERIESASNYQLSVMSFRTPNLPVRVKCVKCSNEWEDSPGHLIKQPYCKKCVLISKSDYIKDSISEFDFGSASAEVTILNQIIKIYRSGVLDLINSPISKSIILLALLRISIDEKTISNEEFAKAMHVPASYIAVITGRIYYEYKATIDQHLLSDSAQRKMNPKKD